MIRPSRIVRPLLRVLSMAAPSAILPAALAVTHPALVCVPTPAVSFFKWPTPQNAALETDDFPHAANVADYLAKRQTLRITPEDRDAFWQTNEAVWQRRYWPSMMPLGAGLKEDVPLYELDFIPEGTTVANLLTTANLFTFDPGCTILTNANRRDFFETGSRFVYVNDILGRWTLGSSGGYAKDSSIYYTPLDESRKVRGEHYWLVPTRYLDDPDPSGAWTVDAPLETADWQTHLVGLGELPDGDVKGYRRIFAAQGTANVITNLMPPWASAYCDRRKIDDFRSLYPADSSSITSRGASIGKTKFKLSDLCLCLNYDSWKTWWNSSRVAPNRWSLANDIAAVCERSLEGYHVATWTDATNEANAVTFPTAQIMRYRFDEEDFTGDVRASKTTTNSIFSIYIPLTGTPQLRLDASALHNLDWTDTTAYATNMVVATNIVEHTVCGWRDVNQSVSLDGYLVDVPVYNQVVGDYSFEIEDNAASDFYNQVNAGTVTPYVWVDLRESPWKLRLRGVGHPPLYIEGFPFTWVGGSTALEIGTLTRSTASFAVTGVVANVAMAYASGYHGRNPVGGARNSNIAAYPDSEQDVRTKDTSSLPPTGRAWSIMNYWSATVYGFATCGVSSDLAAVTDAVGNGRFDAVTNSPSSAKLYARHWKESSDVRGSTTATQWSLASSRVSDVLDCFSKFGGDLEKPTRDAAEHPDADGLAASIREALLHASGEWQASPQTSAHEGEVLLQIPFKIEAQGNRFYVTIKADDMKLNPIFKLTFSVGSTFRGDDVVPPRHSAAATYEVRPVVVTDWKFPSMRPKDDE